MLNYRRNFKVVALGLLLYVCTAGCTEEILDAEPASGLLKIIHTGHNYGQNVPNALYNRSQLLSLAKNPDNTYTFYDAGAILVGNIFDPFIYSVLNKTVIGQNGSLIKFITYKRERGDELPNQLVIDGSYQFYPFPLFGEALFSVNPNLDQVAVLSNSEPLRSISLFDGELKAKGKVIEDYGFNGFFGLKASTDGGAIGCYLGVDPVGGVEGKLIKIKNDLTVDFDVSFSLNEFPGIFSFWRWDRPKLDIIEKSGAFFLFYYVNEGPEPDLIQIHHVNPSGLSRLKEVQVPEIDQDNYSGIQDIVAYDGGYALITVYGNVYFLDNSFNPVTNMVSLPDLKEGLLYRSFHLYALKDKIYFVGATPDNPEGDLCPDCSPYDEDQPPRLSIGTVDSNGNVRRKVLNLGGRIFQCRSVFNEDGSAAHIALVETSPRAREVMFFKTDSDFNLVK